MGELGARIGEAMLTDDVRSTRTRAGTVSFILLCLVVTGSALAVGAQHTAVLLAATFVAGLAATFAWFFSGPIVLRSSATLVTVVGAALVAFTVLQLVPIPLSVLRHVSPHGAEVWSHAFAPFGEPGPRDASVSLDPIASRIAVVRGITYLLVFLASVRLSARRTMASRLAVLVTLSALLVAMLSVAHPAFGARKLYGIYTPTFTVAERHIAPFLNPNHLAEYMNIGFCISLAMALATDPPLPRAIAGAITLLLGTIQLWVGSRGGVAAMIVGAILLLWLTQRRDVRSRNGILVAFFVCAAAAVVVALGDSEARDELITADLSKFDLFRHALRMSMDYAFVGCGRGAFESVFAAYRGGQGYVVFTHPENIVAQWACEWGWPITAAAFGALAWALRPRVLNARSMTATGPWVALVVTVIDNLADFGSEIPGIMIAAAVCAGIVLGGTSGTSVRARWSSHPRVVGLSCLGAAVCALLASATALGRDLRADRDRAAEAALNPQVSPPEFLAVLHKTVARHPAEPYLPYTGVLRAVMVGHENVMPWAERTLTLSPIHGPVHYLLARSLALRSPSQARLEYRLALQQAPELRAASISDGSRLVHGFDDALELAPATDVAALLTLVPAIAQRLPATRSRLDDLIYTQAPETPEPLRARVAGAAEDLESQDGSAPWCALERPSCERAALNAAEALVHLDDHDSDAHVLKARILIATGQSAQSIDDLLQACDRVAHRAECLREAVTLSLRSGDSARASNAIQRLERGGCANDEECAANDEFLGDTELSRGNILSAFVHYQHALERGPDDIALLSNCAGLASRAGLHAQSRQYYERLTHKQPGNAQWKAALMREERATMSEHITP